MKYGLTRKLNVYGFEQQRGEVVIATSGDYIKSQLWCSKHLKGVEEGISDIYQTYAWAWFALQRNGMLDAFGLAGELTRDALDEMACAVTVYMEAVPDDSLPLADSETQQTR